MKKCKYCGELQEDTQTNCIKCGELLGSPLTKNEEVLVKLELQNRKSNNSSDNYDDYFFVGKMCKVLVAIFLLCTTLLIIIKACGYGNPVFIVTAVIVTIFAVAELLFPRFFWELIKPRWMVEGKMEPSTFAAAWRIIKAFFYLILEFIYVIYLLIKVIMS